MNLGNLQSAAGRIQEALEDLQVAWAATREHWDDQPARDFEEQVLAVISQEVSTAFPALGQLTQSFQAAGRACSERSSGGF